VSAVEPIPEKPRTWAYLSWPNRISLMRLMMVAPFVVLLMHHQAQPVYRYLALGIFIVMGFSDILDGYLARRLDCKTRLGAILDPMADKVLIVCAAVLLSLPHSAVKGAMLPDWVVVMIVGKDLWVVAGCLVVFLVSDKVRVTPSLPGKMCTFAQLLLVGFVLLSPEINLIGWQVGSYIVRGLCWVVAVLAGLSVISYTRIGIATVAEADQDNVTDSGRQPE